MMNYNTEHDLIEAEAVGAEIAESDEDFRETLLEAVNAEAMQEKMLVDAKKRANKILRKNKGEIKRLKNHAGECLIMNNFEGYSYAIKKLRGIYKQPYTQDLIKSMWNTSRQSLLDIVESNQKA